MHAACAGTCKSQSGRVGETFQLSLGPAQMWAQPHPWQVHLRHSAKLHRDITPSPPPTCCGAGLSGIQNNTITHAVEIMQQHCTIGRLLHPCSHYGSHTEVKNIELAPNVEVPAKSNE